MNENQKSIIRRISLVCTEYRKQTWSDEEDTVYKDICQLCKFFENAKNAFEFEMEYKF